MANLQPVTINKNLDVLKESTFSKLNKDKNKNNEFNLIFSAFENKDKTVHLSFLLEVIPNKEQNQYYAEPAILSSHFPTYNCREAVDFIFYTIKVFNPYKRAILTFEDGKQYSLKQYGHLPPNKFRGL